MSGRAYVDYTQRPIRYTAYARRRLRERFIREDDVWYVLAHHVSDLPSPNPDTPQRREVVGEVTRRMLVVIEPNQQEVLVVNAFPIDDRYHGHR